MIKKPTVVPKYPPFQQKYREFPSNETSVRKGQEAYPELRPVPKDVVVVERKKK